MVSGLLTWQSQAFTFYCVLVHGAEHINNNQDEVNPVDELQDVECVGCLHSVSEHLLVLLTSRPLKVHHVVHGGGCSRVFLFHTQNILM